MGAKPILDDPPSFVMKLLVWLFVLVPFAALVAAVPLAWQWGWGPSLLDVVMAVVMYCITCAGIGVGFHRYFTHGAFKATRGLRVTLALAGSLAGEGDIVQWVADHRRHHAYSDREGDPHSPWAHGKGPWGLARGLWHAHWGWLFKRQLSNRERFAPDLLADKDIRLIDKLFPVMVAISLGGPALIGGVATWSWTGALSAFFWAGLVRFALLHHVTWSINSICHVFGNRPFETAKEGDMAANFWPLALLSFGEAWHNLHHADPTCARHGVDKGQIDVNARLIWLFEKLGWAYDVRWPRQERLAAKRRIAA
jgi:stearoyl-CoA desaturase (delta-9 desaturase)